MSSKNMLRKVTKYVWDFVLFKLKCGPIPADKKFPGIPIKMCQSLSMTVWLETYVSLSKWRDYVYQHGIRMNLSNKLYASYAIYACHIEIEIDSDPCKRFVYTMALVIQMALYSSEDRQIELLEYSQEIWLKVFEIKIQEEFCAKGGWINLYNHLQRWQCVESFKFVEYMENEKKFPQQIIEELDLNHADGHQQISEHFAHGISSIYIENHAPTLQILKSIYSVLESIRLKFIPPKQDSTETNTDTTENQEFKKLFPKDNTKSGKGSEDVLKQTTQRVSTRQMYLRAKQMLQILQNDFNRLLELLEYVYLV